MHRIYSGVFWGLCCLGMLSCSGFYNSKQMPQVGVPSIKMEEAVADQRGYNQKTDTAYYPDGAIKSIAFYTKERENRIENGYTEDGLLWYSSAYKKDLRDGKTTQYDAYGLLEYIGEFKEGKPQGWMRHYNENGEPEADVLYEAGVQLQIIPVRSE